MTAGAALGGFDDPLRLRRAEQITCLPDLRTERATGLDHHWIDHSVSSRKSRRRDFNQLTLIAVGEPARSVRAMSERAVARTPATMHVADCADRASNTLHARITVLPFRRKPFAHAVARTKSPGRGNNVLRSLHNRKATVTNPRQICATSAAASAPIKRMSKSETTIARHRALRRDNAIAQQLNTLQSRP